MIKGIGAFPALFAINMLINTDSGGTWTYGKYSNWLEDAGFSVLPFTEIEGRQLIMAKKVK